MVVRDEISDEPLYRLAIRVRRVLRTEECSRAWRVAGIAMSAVQQPVVDDYGISRSQAERQLPREITQSDMSRLEFFRSVSVRLGKNGMNRRTLAMRCGQDAEGTVLCICVR